VTVTVKKGDTLSEIAARHALTLKAGADVVGRQNIHDRAIADEAVAASGPTVRLEARVEQAARLRG
jgi:hypothetical protein